MEKQKEKNKKKVRQIVSEILPSGEILELIYRENQRDTMLIVANQDGIRYVDTFERPHETLVPLKADNPLITKKVVLFPSDTIDYGTTKELISKIQAYIHKYVDISIFFEKIASYYVLFSWVYDKFNELPYLRLLGDYGTGKSRALRVIGSLCYKPMFVGGATTTSPIFRIIDQFGGTLILDEADYRFSDTTSEIIKILNSGYQKGVAVLRSEGKGTFEIKSYDVYGPKIVGNRVRFQDPALESRFLIEEMEKKEMRPDVPINLPDSFENEALELRNQLLCWRLRNVKQVGLKDQEIDRTLEPRLNQIIVPILSIVDDADVKRELRDFIKDYNEQLITDRGMSKDSEVLEALLFHYEQGETEPSAKQVADQFNLGAGKRDEITPRKAGSILRNNLKLLVRRGGGGKHVVSEAENYEKVSRLKRKFGISILQSGQVNVLNVENVVGGAPIEKNEPLLPL